VAEVFAVVQGFANVAFAKARADGRREPEEAYLADGLLAACRAAAAGSPEEAGDSDSDSDGDGQGQRRRRPRRRPTPTKVIVRIDWDALIRGWPIRGEVSEIAGLGPVPVSTVQRMIESGDPFLAAVVTKGQDVANVVHLGRRPVAAQRTALEWLSPTCTTLGCNNSHRLEIDHREDWADTKVTLLRWLERHCSHCHDKKTRLGWELVEGRGKRPLVPPDDPRHPRYRGAEARAG
jgi:hypothetical protein